MEDDLFEDDDEGMGCCPLCGWSIDSNNPCSHFITSASDDGEIYPDSPFPLYIAIDFWPDEFPVRGTWYSKIFDFFKALESLAASYQASDKNGKNRMKRETSGLDPWDRKLVKSMFEVINQNADSEDECLGIFDFVAHRDARNWLKALYKAANPGRSLVKEYEVCSGPGASWSGTNFWAEDASACMEAMNQKLTASTAFFNRLAKQSQSGDIAE
jgi:hypothetical protein